MTSARLLLLLALPFGVLAGGARLPAAAPAEAVPNDNRTAGGRLEGGVLTLALEARLASWRPDLDVDSAVTVQAFAEAGGAPRILEVSHVPIRPKASPNALRRWHGVCTLTFTGLRRAVAG